MNTNHLLVEFMGTFVFLFVIMQSGKFGHVQPFVIASGLLVAVLMFGSISGGHFNPAVSTMLYVNGDVNVPTLTILALYVVVQVAGGLSAASLTKYLKQ